MREPFEILRRILLDGPYRTVSQRLIRRFVDGGESALDAFLASRADLISAFPSRDTAEFIDDIICMFAREIPDVLIDRFEAGEIGEMPTYWALGFTKGRRSIEVLFAGLKSKDSFARWEAAEALIRRKCKRACPALIKALKDRSSDVKGGIVFGMKSNKFLRQPEALPALRRIVSSEAILRHSPGIHKAAQDVIKMIERETGALTPPGTTA